MEGTEQWKVQVEQLKVQMEQWLERGLEFVHQIPPIQLYVGVVIVHGETFGNLKLTTPCLLAARLFKRRKSNTIVLSGLSGSGKTILFYQLRDGSSHQGTVTSMEPNEGTFVLHSEIAKKDKLKPVHLVDVPGHSRLRAKLDDFLPQAAGVVFVVDALDFLPNCRAASEYLYDILTNASVVKKKIPVLILCNKTDKVTAHTKEFINRQMEKEIDKLRVSRSAISTADISNDFTLGIPGKAFSFTQCYNKVAVAEASGLTGEVSEVEQFIRENVKF
ncbi:signal recognition particle receptor subunit beta-like [Cucumis melo var. makuwa]|uniref:Signal recognition particle receptor subunit beta n=1 Tax=Cucumis melo var. makuwa TaxID=1194695 RepID=A0A5D3CWJ2_CUCMM|nr:signal recognition particle receptor subunit beta-like [Cucumis melo var. makuwa]